MLDDELSKRCVRICVSVSILLVQQFFFKFHNFIVKYHNFIVNYHIFIVKYHTFIVARSGQGFIDSAIF